MCGIAGAFNSISSDTLQVGRMLALIRHRGPDDAGEWRGSSWHIGMTRLAIMDLEHGRQPMRSADGRWVIVLNGEIYNFLHLRDQLRRTGTVFNTHSDTEVLLELIAERGVPAALEAIEGMFAFAAVDTHEGDLWLARDRFGEKPLFIDRRGVGFSFCSELAPLIESGNDARNIDGAALAALLRFGYPWPGTTAVQGISELRPAHWLRKTKSGEESQGCYWKPPDRVDEQTGTIEQCGARLLELLDSSVRDRLVADVPLGLFLSGGIDSGAVAASAAPVRPDIHAVTVGFDSESYDERPLARQTAAHLEISLEEEQGTLVPYSTEYFDQILRHYGQPFMDTSAVPTWAVSRAARKHFKVVLSGDGGDELLGGYLSHQRDAMLARFGGGAPGGAIARALARCTPETGAWESLHRALELNGSRHQGLLPLSMNGVFSDSMIKRLFSGTGLETVAGRQLEEAQEECRTLCANVKDSCLALSLHQLRTSFPQDILMKVDRMSMAESLEVRAPFLDSRLAAYALSLPSHFKLHSKLGKYVLRQALRGRLPNAVLQAPKRGFAMPVRQWLGQQFWRDLNNEVEHYGRDGNAELNLSALRQQVEDDRRRCAEVNSFRAVHRAVLIYSFLRWRRLLLPQRPKSEMARPVGVEA